MTEKKIQSAAKTRDGVTQGEGKSKRNLNVAI